MKRILIIISVVILIGIIFGNTYEFFRRKRKSEKATKKEAQIVQEYISAANKSDIYGFKQKFAVFDDYNFDKIRKYWDCIGYMFHVPYLMYQYTPNVRNSHLNTNDMGFRGKINFSHLPSMKPLEEYHYIVVLGGSVAFGAYSSSDEKCFSSILEAKLNKEFNPGKKFKVINLGMGFYNSLQEFISYILYGLQFHPELVITLDGFNDSAVPLIEKKLVPLATGNYYKTEQVLSKVNIKFMKRSNKNICNNSNIEEMSWYKETDSYAQDVAKLYERNLDLLCLIAREKGTKILLTLQPIKTFPDGKFAWEDKRVEFIYTLLPSILENLSKKYNGRFINFHKIFEENKSFNQYFVSDPVHLSDRGQDIIATYLFEEAKKVLQ